MKLFWGKRKWKQEKTKEWSNLTFFFLFLFKTAFFGHTWKKSTHSLFGAWSFLSVHIWFTPNEGSKDFINSFLKESDHGSWTIKSDHGKGPSSMVWLHGPWCKLALTSTISVVRGMKSSMSSDLGRCHSRQVYSNSLMYLGMLLVLSFKPIRI